MLVPVPVPVPVLVPVLVLVLVLAAAAAALRVSTGDPVRVVAMVEKNPCQTKQYPL